MLSSFASTASNKENSASALRTRSTKDATNGNSNNAAATALTTPTATRTFGANLTNQEKSKARGKAALQPSKSSQNLVPTSSATKRRAPAPADSIPDVEYMPNVTPYKYEPQLDLEVDLKKPRTRLPITPSAAPRKKAAKSLMAPMSMDEFAFLDDQFVVGIDRPSATLAAAPLSVFEVPDDIFVNGDATDTKL